MENSTIDIPSILAIIALVAKAAVDHFKIGELYRRDGLSKKRLNDMHNEQLKMVEALNRTYATEKFVYEVFITRKEHDQEMQHIEEKFLGELSHQSKMIERICNIMENGTVSVKNHNKDVA
jgi:hypothetical protein